jgi:hypothetical protein
LPLKSDFRPKRGQKKAMMLSKPLRFKAEKKFWKNSKEIELLDTILTVQDCLEFLTVRNCRVVLSQPADDCNRSCASFDRCVEFLTTYFTGDIP